ncbi:WD40-repeat-containing domain protein [Rhypophila sp. PSN 637]
MAKPTTAADLSEWDFPKLRTTFQMTLDSEGTDEAEFFDVKFYPYGSINAPPVFAATSKKHAVICRLKEIGEKEKDKNPCEILRVIRDDDETARNCTCCWSKDPVTGAPWLLVAGNDAKIKIYDVVEGKLVRTLVGHGGGINDITTSPANPAIIASASDDTTVRIWSLDKVHSSQPCVAILGGEGHIYDLLSVAFHRTGRYLLSAGHDQWINLWTLPDIPNKPVDIPIVLHYPHFASCEVHGNLVDCVAFYGDMILSRACHEDKIVLWRVEGFDSGNPPLPPLGAPTNFDPKEQTRSAFAKVSPPNRYALFTRLLQFSTPDCHSQFFMRFRMFHTQNKHPILAFANAKSKTFFWDMNRFREYNRFIDALDDHEEANKSKETPNGRPPPPPEKPHWLLVKKGKAPNPRAVTGGAGGAGGKNSMATASPDPDNVIGLGGYNQRTLTEWAEMYETGNPQALIRCHKQNTIDGSFVGRQVAWSPEGDWCVVVGNQNNAILYHRWGKDTKGASSKDRKGSTPVPTVTATNGSGNRTGTGTAHPFSGGSGGSGVLAPPPAGQPVVFPVVGGASSAGTTYTYGPPDATPGLFDSQAA